MQAQRNPGINQDSELYPFMVELGSRGSANYQVFYITSFMQCTCSRPVNCQHVQAVRDMVNAERITKQVDGDFAYDLSFCG